MYHTGNIGYKETSVISVVKDKESAIPQWKSYSKKKSGTETKQKKVHGYVELSVSVIEKSKK